MLRELTGIRRIVIKTGKTDLRMGITGLASLVRLEYGMNALEEGTIFSLLRKQEGQDQGTLLRERRMGSSLCSPVKGQRVPVAEGRG